MNATLRVGIVGADAKGQGWAPLAHLPALRSLRGFEIAAVCTAHADTARAAAERYGIPNAYHDVRRMLAEADVDVVSVVVRAPNHHDVVTAALEAGKNVYCEWPLGANTAQAEAMARLARERGVSAVVGLQARCDPALRYLRDLVAEGYVGEVLSVSMSMMSPGALDHPGNRAWESDPAQGVSALTIRGMHSLDALCFCVGELAEVSARVTTQVPQWRIVETGEMIDTRAPDNVVVAGMLTGGAIVGAHIATVPYNASGWRMEIYGRDGTLIVTSNGAPQRDRNLVRGARGKEKLAELAVPAKYVEVPAETPAGPPNNVAHLYLRLAKAIREGSAVEPDFEHALRRHRLIDAIQRASDERRPVAID